MVPAADDDLLALDDDRRVVIARSHLPPLFLHPETGLAAVG
jgi:hypothetical protein